MKMMGRTTTAKTQRRAASTPSSSSNAVRPLQPAEDTRPIKINYVYRGKTFQKDFQKRFCFTFVFLVILRLLKMGKKQYRGSKYRVLKKVAPLPVQFTTFKPFYQHFLKLQMKRRPFSVRLEYTVIVNFVKYLENGLKGVNWAKSGVQFFLTN